MKNKKITYILIPLVAIIWGFVIFKIFNYTDDGGNYNQNISNSLKFKEENAVVDTFTIVANYIDPFLGKFASSYRNQDIEISEENNSENIVKKPEINKIVAPKPFLRWPQIEYGGIVYNSKTQKKLALVKINNQEQLAKIGDAFNKVKLLEIFPDSIKVQFETETKTINKN